VKCSQNYRYPSLYPSYLSFKPPMKVVKIVTPWLL